MIRFATSKDAPKIAELVLVILKDMELPILEKADDQLILKVLEEAMKDPDYRYGYHRGLVNEVDGEVAGIAFGYFASEEETIDESLKKALDKFDLADQSLFTEQESFAGEWYLDTLCVDKNYRGKGVGSELLTAAQVFAAKSGASVIGLCVDHQNEKAQHLYEEKGFKVVGEQVLSDHPYHHMQKQLT
ncbi:GNAT family N-acetyltransferase [Tetragenococcus osmophilus]|uniref:N-acetyltransferase n=1 Tax=Tetragenococcus osmophilus TaxID=526944 RepID=A0AA37XJB5_9ENTE|nr:GNAT family N-acetyltransferase [Tetragenococcus osmophilus]AYW46997.1 GNAT family N-acetyltransferase [Tetragenococcus osmophilus]GMA71174.1 N-acetyltransferase [Tetragenococcus osmophilus]